MTATYAGDTYAASGENWILDPTRGAPVAEWIGELCERPSRVTITVTDPVPVDAALTVDVPALAVAGGPQLQAKTYNVPLRGEATQTLRLQHTLLGLKVDDKTTEIQLRGVAKIGRRDIEATVEVSAAGDLMFDVARGLQAEGTLEKTSTIIKSATLKAAATATLGGKAAIKGTFEVLYIVGYELTQVT